MSDGSGTGGSPVGSSPNSLREPLKGGFERDILFRVDYPDMYFDRGASPPFQGISKSLCFLGRDIG